jgi:hypothetical protein
MPATARAKKDKEKKVVQCDSVTRNELLAFVYYATVDDIGRGGKTLHMTDVDRGMEFKVEGQQLIESSLSADQFHTTKKTTKTKVAEMLVQAYNRPFTVCFTKTDGKERTLRGRLIQPEPLLGRSMVEDLDLERTTHRMRQVDHRTIKFLILDGVKYEVRK